MYVAEHPKEDAAAIASLETAQHVGLEILAENIQDNELNQTRFGSSVTERWPASSQLQ